MSLKFPLRRVCLCFIPTFGAIKCIVYRFCSAQEYAKDYYGIPATNREIVFIETHVQTLKDGKIIENVVSATNLEFEMLMAPVLAPMVLK